MADPFFVSFAKTGKALKPCNDPGPPTVIQALMVASTLVVMNEYKAPTREALPGPAAACPSRRTTVYQWGWTLASQHAEQASDDALAIWL